MIKLVEEASATSTSATRPGAFLVNAFPARKFSIPSLT